MAFVTDYLEKAAERSPEKIALVDEVRQMTYGELWQDAQRIGGVLASQAQVKTPVALWLGREGRSIAASQGAALAGFVYATLDISMPHKRLRKIFDLLNPAAIVTDEKHQQDVEAFASQLDNAPLILIYEDMVDGEMRADEVSALAKYRDERKQDDAVSVIFTSGSTGTPKGVVASHEMISAYTDWQVEALALDSKMVRAGQTPLYFGMGAWSDVYATLATGGVLHLLQPKDFLFPKKLMETLARLEVNTIFWVPSLFRRVAEMDGLSGEKMPPLKTVCFCGEPMPMWALAAWQKAFPKAAFSNHYGATETTVAAWHQFDETEEAGSMPIGEACQGRTIIRLLAEDGSEAPQGAVGEIMVLGPVAKGYLGDEELTRRSFGIDEKTGKRFFRTGDLARYDSKGCLTYVSRGDAQVKHMGYRIELGEIEAAADAVEGLLASVCLFDKEKDTLVLFYTAAEGLTEKQLLTELTDSLPRYMWPARLVKLSAMPQKQGGKVDRMALKEMI